MVSLLATEVSTFQRFVIERSHCIYAMSSYTYREYLRTGITSLDPYKEVFMLLHAVAVFGYLA